jgi:hypothetical protein
MNAHYRAVKNKRNKLEILKYEEDLETNVANLLNQLKNDEYKLGKYREFTIYEPKERIIKSLPYKDRIVQQWYVYEFIKPYIIPRFIKDTYACLDNRGTHKCVLQTQKYMKQMNKKYKTYYIIKGDIKKYFYSIDKDILFKIMHKYIKDKKLLELTKIFIYDNDSKKSIPIGNYTSQYFANIYLNELDQYIKNELNIRYYLRYMDDFCILISNKNKAKLIYTKIETFLNINLKLQMNNKSRYYPSKFGINFCGYVIHENYILLRKRCIKNLKKKSKEENFDINIYKGHLLYANCFNFINTII